MSDNTQQRVEQGRDMFLLVADDLGQQGETGGVVADAILSASLFVLLSVLDDRSLAADRLRRIADDVERGGDIDRPEVAQ